MKYSIAESKVTRVASVVSAADEQLRQTLNTAQAVVAMIDKALDGAGEVIAEIDSKAASGEELYVRLKARKDEVRNDVMASRANAVAIVAAIQDQLG